MSELEQLKQQCEGCMRCPLGQTRTNMVFGVGNENADIMLIGEGPGEQEDLSGVPFVGKAGQYLDQILSIIDLSRQVNVYIANIVKCRPPQNRDPKNEEQDACIEYVMKQIELVKPKIIICLGRIAATRLIHEDYRITKEHGQWVFKDGIWYTSIFHPSALLRDPGKRPDTFLDLKVIQAKIKEVIS